ncbi:hypothetical protein GUJ93_ZPchr0004g39307 [Zizania palustris]|uniref:Uncharacterized protein n=1 Tax=Zizania palustris TaxID=103762 RepID=A0A8J5SC12_ZIZPA|nr:hypothetical protein GUJ93_ZPchr0004g39307 [Zizania palustris]
MDEVLEHGMKKSFEINLIDDANARSNGELLMGSHHMAGNANIVSLAMLGATAIVDGNTKWEKSEGVHWEISHGERIGGADDEELLN